MTKRPLWTLDASARLSSIAKQKRLSTQTGDELLRQAEAWAMRRIADNDAHGYDDEPRRVTESDVDYAWAYMCLCAAPLKPRKDGE